MAVMNESGVRVALIDASGSGEMARYDVVCVHTIVGHDPANAAHFSTGGYGEITQSRDTRYRSAANLNGNYRVIAIENEDFGAPFPPWGTNDGRAVPAFTAEQCEAIARILAWCHKMHGIPLVFVTDSRPTTRGVSFHRAGCDGNFTGYAFGGRVSGGELWSAIYGKVCPGDRRIFQLRDIIIPRARVLAGLEQGGTVTYPTSYPDPGTVTKIDNIGRVLVGNWDMRAVISGAEQPTPGSILGRLKRLEGVEGQDDAVIAELHDVQADLAAALAGLQDDEATIVAAVRDPQNPATAELVTRILAGVTAALEAHEDPEIVVGPEHVQAVAEAVVSALPAALRPAFERAVADVLRGGVEDYPPDQAG